MFLRTTIATKMYVLYCKLCSIYDDNVMPIIHTSVLSCFWNNRKYVRKRVPSANRDIYNFNSINCFQTNLETRESVRQCAVLGVSRQRGSGRVDDSSAEDVPWWMDARLRRLPGDQSPI